MKVRYFIPKSLLLLLAVMSLSGCNKSLDNKSTRYSSEENQWQSIQDAKSGLMGVYALTRTALVAENAHWMLGELRNGDFTSYVRTDLKEIKDGNLNSSFPLIEKVSNWRRFYAAINAANVFIEKASQILEHDPLYTADNLKLDINQAKMLRAFAYFYMVRVWGDVPLIIYSHDNGQMESKPRTDKALVLDYITKDILNTVNDLPYYYGAYPVTYHNQNSERWVGVLFNKLSAYALLANIAAWQGDYEKVEAYTGFIELNKSKMGTLNISTTADLVSAAGMFQGSKNQHFIAFPFNELYGEYSKEGHLEDLTLAAPITSKAFPDIYVSKDRINSLFVELGDQRHGVDTLTGKVNSLYFDNFNSEIPIFDKVKIFISSATNGSFNRYSSTIVVSRYEDIVLLRAEALAVLKREGEAIAELNRIRSARGLNAIVVGGSSGKALLKAIFIERQKEFMGEGSRWYDEIRYQRLVREDAKMVALIDHDGIYWPIAKDVLKANSLLTQNAYWK